MTDADATDALLDAIALLSALGQQDYEGMDAIEQAKHANVATAVAHVCREYIDQELVEAQTFNVYLYTLRARLLRARREDGS